MSTYLFQLGRQRLLSQEELFAVLAQAHIHVAHTRTTGSSLILTTNTPLDPSWLMDRLGGTILIGEKIEASGNAEDTIYTYLSAFPSDKKIHFSIDGGASIRTLAMNIKKRLKKQGRSVRYVQSENTATILHNNLVEKASHLTIVDNVVYVTKAIQPIEELSKKDYGRPRIDDKSGMLPPKLARMMVNLAMPQTTEILLDPFCGSGTLLAEALSLGITSVIGSDISKKATADTEKNLSWLIDMFHLQDATYRLYTHDVRTLEDILPPQSVDGIATEPFLGVPRTGRESRSHLEMQANTLASLYDKAFATFAKILKPGGRVVFVVPRFRYRDEWITVPCEHLIAQRGFELFPFHEADMPILYHRESQHVGREIWRWKKV